ncbi:hypothetical protein BH23BAC1_BH23BAC1_30460 [soil metagenome]
MKTLKGLPVFCVLALIFTICLVPEKARAQARTSITFQTFYDELSPYGQWVNNPQYGYVWLPNAGPGFQPYATNGHWVVTEYGNTWVSNYAWGWAPFHYGRWFMDDYFGWAWVPGNVWGPAWVNWRSANGYYGWAPLGPGIHVNVAVNIPLAYWTFVPYRYFTSPRIYAYYVPRRRVVNVYNTSTVINNYYTTNNYTYASGPSKTEIEKVTRTRVPVRQISQADQPGRTEVNSTALRVYRPAVSESKETSIRPARVSDGKVTDTRRSNTGSNINTTSDRNTTNIGTDRSSRTSGTTSGSENVRTRSGVNSEGTNYGGNNRRSEYSQPNQRSAESQRPASVQQRPASESGSEMRQRTPSQREQVQTPTQRETQRSAQVQRREQNQNQQSQVQKRQESQSQPQVQKREAQRQEKSTQTPARRQR